MRPTTVHRTVNRRDRYRAPVVRVRHGGRVQDLPAGELVPGDPVLLGAACSPPTCA